MSERIHQFTSVIQSWQRLLRITGGDISPSKSLTYFITFGFDSSGAPYILPMASLPGQVQFVSDDGEICNIKRLEATTAERTLGVRLAPSGQWDTEFNYRYSQLQQFCGRLQAAPFTPIDAEIIYQCRWIPISHFCLPLTHFSKQQCEQYSKIHFYSGYISTN